MSHADKAPSRKEVLRSSQSSQAMVQPQASKASPREQGEDPPSKSRKPKKRIMFQGDGDFDPGNVPFQDLDEVTIIESLQKFTEAYLRIRKAKQVSITLCPSPVSARRPHEPLTKAHGHEIKRVLWAPPNLYNGEADAWDKESPDFEGFLKRLQKEHYIPVQTIIDQFLAGAWDMLSDARAPTQPEGQPGELVRFTHSLDHTIGVATEVLQLIEEDQTNFLKKRKKASCASNRGDEGSDAYRSAWKNLEDRMATWHVGVRGMERDLNAMDPDVSPQQNVS
ncbi:hypothetical protein NMY22_g1288 [Coprinellus aureogranulatus]|nr:hypothetical protein NMY22_g1288 [Coprinellus aureogranulatus]